MVIVVFGIIAGVLLDRLRFYQEAAEKADMEFAIRAIKSELRIRMASMLIQGHAHEYASLVGKNPVEWMIQKPANYLGSLRRGEMPRAIPGNWYFDEEMHSLVYLVRTGSHFAADEGVPRQVRLRVVEVSNQASSNGKIQGTAPSSIAIQVDPYRWF